MISIQDQIAFIDEMIGHTGDKQELEALEAIRKSLLSVSDPSACGTSPKKGRNSKKKPKISLQYYQDFVGVYDQFCRGFIGAPGIIDNRQGAALKQVVAYLMKQDAVNGSEEKALEAWKYIFKNWSVLSDFIRKQTKLSDIQRNIQEILVEFRNVSKQAKQRKSDSDWDTYRQLRKGE